MHGRIVKIPKGYKGVILSSTDQKLLQEPQASEEEEEEEKEQPEEIEILEGQAEFDEVMVWGHEALPDESTDPYVRGVGEWIAFAEQVGSGPRFQCSSDTFRSTSTLHREVKFRNPRSSHDRIFVVPKSYRGVGLQFRRKDQDLQPPFTITFHRPRPRAEISLSSFVLPIPLLPQKFPLKLLIPLMSLTLFHDFLEHQTCLFLSPLMPCAPFNLSTILLVIYILPQTSVIGITLRSRHAHLDEIPGHIHPREVFVLIII